jgi:hypothetical protein
MILFGSGLAVGVGLLAMGCLFSMIVGTMAFAMPMQYPRFFPAVAVTRNAGAKNHRQGG